MHDLLHKKKLGAKFFSIISVCKCRQGHLIYCINAEGLEQQAHHDKSAES